jgi:L-threonylcarbamoyladenylate synthase
MSLDRSFSTTVLPIRVDLPEPDIIARAAAILRAGGLVAFPTETVYGLGAHGLDPAAVARIFAAKGRPPSNPLILHVHDRAGALSLAAEWPEPAERLARRFWPGPLTLVVPRSPIVPDLVTAGGPTVAVRMPAHPVARALIEAAGVPIAAPSANRSTQLSPTRAEHVLSGLNGRIALLLDGGPTAGGLESTVLDVTCSPPRLLRPGPIGPTELEAITGPIARPAAAAESGQPLRSPGLLARHYAPRAPLECVADGQERAAELCRRGFRVGWLTFASPSVHAPHGAEVRFMPADPVAYAAQLYAVLHELDDAGVERILVALPPDEEAWLAIRDRLRRAATRDERRA